MCGGGGGGQCGVEMYSTLIFLAHSITTYTQNMLNNCQHFAHRHFMFAVIMSSLGNNVVQVNLLTYRYFT